MVSLYYKDDKKWRFVALSPIIFMFSNVLVAQVMLGNKIMAILRMIYTVTIVTKNPQAIAYFNDTR